MRRLFLAFAAQKGWHVCGETSGKLGMFPRDLCEICLRFHSRSLTFTNIHKKLLNKLNFLDTFNCHSNDFPVSSGLDRYDVVITIHYSINSSKTKCVNHNDSRHYHWAPWKDLKGGAKKNRKKFPTRFGSGGCCLTKSDGWAIERPVLFATQIAVVFIFLSFSL